MSKEILIVDDEPQNIFWLVDFLEANGYAITQATNLNEALAKLSEKVFRIAIIDLNVPALEPLDAQFRKEGGVYARFPGLYAARFARNFGYRDRQTILYSVHQDAEVAEQAEKMRCKYLLKGRPQAFKEELMDVLSYDPSED